MSSFAGELLRRRHGTLQEGDLSRKLDAVSQHELVPRLAIAIDLAKFHQNYGSPDPTSTRAERNLGKLVDANPRSVLSRHVQHNIGKRRREWLAAWLASREPIASSL